MSDDYKMVMDKKIEMSNLISRMEEDEDDYFLKPYEMYQLPPNDSKKVDDVANVTLNDPLLYAVKVMSILNASTRQTVIEGEKMTDKQTTLVEQFLEDVYYQIDERLVKRGILSLSGYVHEQICIRGRTVARICVRLDKEGKLVLDLLPVDAISFVYDTDDNGFAWCAPIYRRSKAQIQKEYGKEISSDYGEVVDLWKPDKNIVFLDEGKIIGKDEENPYKYPPFVQSICPIGSMLSTDNATEHQGESIFWANRDLWAEKNRTATILQTLNISALFNSLQYESSKGESASKPGDSPFGMRKVLPVEKGGGYKPMPINDIKAATRLFYAILDASIQKGSVSVVDYGSLTFPLSAVAITQLTGSRDDILLPRVQAEALFYQAASQMIIDQCIQLNKKLVVKNTYNPSDLKGDYTIKYRFFTESKEQQVADLSIANAAKDVVSGDTIRRDYLKLKDPDGEEAKLLAEQAERADEVLFLYNRACKLIEKEQPLEAYILAKRIVTILRQRQVANSMVEAQGKSAGQNKEGLIPLLGEARGKGQKTTEELPTEEKEIEEVERV